MIEKIRNKKSKELRFRGKRKGEEVASGARRENASGVPLIQNLACNL